MGRCGRLAGSERGEYHLERRRGHERRCVCRCYLWASPSGPLRAGGGGVVVQKDALQAEVFVDEMRPASAFLNGVMYDTARAARIDA